jgi:hypothetical protein
MDNYDITQLVSDFNKKLSFFKNEFDLNIKQKTEYNKTYNTFFNKFISAIDANNEVLENLILTSQTQMGKTKLIIDTIKIAKDYTISIIVLDNKTEHFNQMETRMKNEGISVENITNKKYNKKYFQELFNKLNNKKSIVFLMLNNSTQIKKLNNVIFDLYKYFKFSNYHLYIDESDTLNKTDEPEISNDDDAVCHKEWIKHFEITDKFKLKNKKRICISATFENNSYLQNVKVKNTFVIPEKIDYAKITTQVHWDKGNLTPLRKEVSRIKNQNSKEVILFCSDYLNSRQEEIAEELNDEFDIPVVLYNGNGILIYWFDERQLVYRGNISMALTYIEKRYTGPVIVVGYRLMDRGISFCSLSKENPLSATVMFYSGSATTTAVNIAQILGRITGTSRPDIKERIVYCDNQVYRTYIDYLENQQMIYNALESKVTLGSQVSKGNENQGSKVTLENKEAFDVNCIELLKDLMKSLPLKKLERKLDRPKLKSVNRQYKERITPPKYSVTDEVDKMKRLVTSWKNENNNDTVAKIFRMLIKSTNYSLPQKDIKKFVIDDGKTTAFENTLHQKNHHTKWYCVFELKNEKINIKQNAIEYYKKL